MAVLDEVADRWGFVVAPGRSWWAARGWPDVDARHWMELVGAWEAVVEVSDNGIRGVGGSSASLSWAMIGAAIAELSSVAVPVEVDTYFAPSEPFVCGVDLARWEP